MNILNMEKSTETKQKLRWDERKETYSLIVSWKIFFREFNICLKQ